MPKRPYETPRIMHDAPLREDSPSADFHFEDFAATLARLIASRDTDTPLTIGINGKWGSGKTSLLWLIKDMLDHPKKGGTHCFAPDDEKDFRACKTVWFDAWKYNDEKELLVALTRVMLQAMREDGFINQLRAWWEDPKQPSYDSLAMFINAFEASFGGLGAEFKFKLDPKKHETPSKFEQYAAFFDTFDETFERLLALWVHGAGDYRKINQANGALVVFIDDLDRCLPAKTVQTLEAIKLFLDKSGCVFLLGADTEIVEKAVTAHYKNADITGESAKDYLEKIIQLRFDLPPIVEDAMEGYLKKQDKRVVPAEMLERWKALIAAAEVNPRRVKNVINDLNLQWYMATNSGQAQGLNRDDFICWQALMRAAPPKFAARVRDFDKETRYKFLMDALKWQQGTQEEKDAVKGFFAEYEEDREAKRLRGVLKEISFSPNFNPDALHAIIYLSAPPAAEPAKPVLPPETSAEPAPELAQEIIFEKPAPPVMRGEGKAAPIRDASRLPIGGMEFVKIPKGSFLMGSTKDNELADDDEKPQHTVEIAYDYWLARFILTNQRFAEFIQDTKHQTTAEKEGGWSPKEGKFVKGIDWAHPTDPKENWKDKEDHPVVQVSWDDAMAYCKWLNQILNSELRIQNLEIRLPTEAEWEKAARGAYANEWPWGNEFDPKKCNSSEGGKNGTTPVGMYSAHGGDSPYGCADMVGNVWEWTHTLKQGYPYKANDGREIEDSRSPRVLRGGSFFSNRGYARCAYRGNYNPLDRDSLVGFRVGVFPIIPL